MAAPETWTIERILKVTQDFFVSRGIDSARLDAELLLVHVLKVPRIKLYTNFDSPLQQTEVDAYRALVKRRASHEPVAYILESREFFGRSFRVTRDVLVPRPETEHLVDAVLEWVRQSERTETRIVDVGTGSGAIAVTLALEVSSARVTAVDISEAALAVAADNARANNAAVTFGRSDLLAEQPGPFDVIVANLPYIGTGEKLPVTVRDHEPHLALFSGADGLDAIRRLIVEAQSRLAPEGLLALEIGATQGPALQELLAGAFTDVRVLKDLAGLARVVTAKKGR